MACITYTVKHLIDELQKLPPGLAVVGEWDTMGQAVHNIKMVAPGKLFVWIFDIRFHAVNNTISCGCLTQCIQYITRTT